MVIEGEVRVVAVLYGFGDVAHQGVEGLGALYEADGKDQLRVLFVFHLDRDVVPGEHVPGAEPELERVSEVDGRCDVGGKAVVDGGLDRRLGGKDPRGAGEVHRHRVDVDARDGEAEFVQSLFGVEGGLGGGLVEVLDRLGDEGPGTAGGVQNVLIQRVGHHLSHHGAGQPVGGVVLAELAAFVGRYDRFVEDGGDVVGRLLPVEPCDTAGEGLEHGQAADLRWPGEEVGFHDALQPVLLRKSRPYRRSPGSVSAKWRMSIPKRAWTTMPMTAVR